MQKTTYWVWACIHLCGHMFKGTSQRLKCSELGVWGSPISCRIESCRRKVEKGSSEHYWFILVLCVISGLTSGCWLPVRGLSSLSQLSLVAGVYLARIAAPKVSPSVFCHCSSLVQAAILLKCHGCSFSVIFRRQNPSADFLILWLVQSYSLFFLRCSPSPKCGSCVVHVSVRAECPRVKFRPLFFCSHLCLLLRVFFDEEWELRLCINLNDPWGC